MTMHAVASAGVAGATARLIRSRTVERREGAVIDATPLPAEQCTQTTTVAAVKASEASMEAR